MKMYSMMNTTYLYAKITSILLICSLASSTQAGWLDELLKRIDSDEDGLTDYYELNEYGTDHFDSDSDDDGLSDGYEINTVSSDPNNTDSDDDGLSDGDEVNSYATDPSNADSDDDGLPDGEEVYLHATDPANADSDGDRLPDGFEIFTFLTDPLDADSDDDGLSDGAEKINGSVWDTADPAQPINGAVIALLDAQGNATDITTTTDAQGAFRSPLFPYSIKRDPTPPSRYKPRNFAPENSM